MNDMLSLIVLIYFVCHLPAFILLIVGLSRRKTKPENAKLLLTIAGIYFLVGGGICGALLS